MVSKEKRIEIWIHVHLVIGHKDKALLLMTDKQMGPSQASNNNCTQFYDRILQ